jgi:hypothetical protein
MSFSAAPLSADSTGSGSGSGSSAGGGGSSQAQARLVAEIEAMLAQLPDLSYVLSTTLVAASGSPGGSGSAGGAGKGR